MSDVVTQSAESSVDSVIGVEQLARLEPLSALSEASLQRLAQIARVIDLPRGKDLICADDWTGRVVYLLRGELKIDYPQSAQQAQASGYHTVVVVVGGSGVGLLPVWRGSMSATITSITNCCILSIDEETLDLVVTWDQLASKAGQGTARSADAASPASNPLHPEWQNLSGLCADQSLVTSAFANVPAANIQRLMSSFQRLEFSRGSVVIKQGDEGDYYYLIERGRCRVLRDIGGVANELAELCDGEGFGEEALVSSVRRNATVIMKTDGVLWRLAKQDFLALLQEPLLQRVSWAEVESGRLTSPVWLDTRFPVEFRQNGIEGAINVPLNEIRDASGVLDKSRDYIVYCQTGRRSSAAAFLLSQRGMRAFLLEGGLNAMNASMEQAA